MKIYFALLVFRERKEKNLTVTIHHMLVNQFIKGI